MGWWRDKPAGLKILWIWAFGTAAIMVTSVARTRMQDMEKMMKAAEQQQKANPLQASGEADGSSPSSEFIRDDKL